MQKTSTQLSYETEVKTVKRPKQSTVDFLKQFARVYVFNELMPAGLGKRRA